MVHFVNLHEQYILMLMHYLNYEHNRILRTIMNIDYFTLDNCLCTKVLKLKLVIYRTRANNPSIIPVYIQKFQK